MKHFKKWWDTYSWTTDVGKQGLGPNKCEVAAKGAYKEALEWVLSLKEGMEGSEVINPELIEKELEKGEKNENDSNNRNNFGHR